MTTPVLAAPLVPRRARLGRYSAWLARDFAINIGIISILLFGLLGLLSIMQVHTMEGFYANRKGPTSLPLGAKLNAFLQSYEAFLSVAPIICVSGLVSQDRTLGYTRFLFAKPLSVRTYYTEALFIRLIGFLALGHVLVLWYGLYEPPSYTWKFAVDMALSFVAMGGIVFLCSVLSKYDGLVAILVILVAVLVWGKWQGATGIGHWATYLLPPALNSGELHRWAIGIDGQGVVVQSPFPWKWSAWNAGYGLACAVLGLYLLRRVPLTKA